jgi:hypothetical protein
MFPNWLLLLLLLLLLSSPRFLAKNWNLNLKSRALKKEKKKTRLYSKWYTAKKTQKRAGYKVWENPEVERTYRRGKYSVNLWFRERNTQDSTTAQSENSSQREEEEKKNASNTGGGARTTGIRKRGPQTRSI